MKMKERFERAFRASASGRGWYSKELKAIANWVLVALVCIGVVTGAVILTSEGELPLEVVSVVLVLLGVAGGILLTAIYADNLMGERHKSLSAEVMDIAEDVKSQRVRGAVAYDVFKWILQRYRGVDEKGKVECEGETERAANDRGH